MIAYIILRTSHMRDTVVGLQLTGTGCFPPVTDMAPGQKDKREKILRYLTRVIILGRLHTGMSWVVSQPAGSSFSFSPSLTVTYKR